jgi:hypothetical protein
VKGQFTQASRTGAAAVVVVRKGDAAIRSAGAEQVVGLDEVVGTLRP